MKRNQPILLGLILGAVTAFAVHASAQNAQAFSEEFHQIYPLTPGGQIELKNINGWVKIASWDRPEVKVDALKYAGTRERLDEASIQVESDPSHIAIKTQYKDKNLTFTSDDMVNNPATVDYTLTVPANARLDAIKLINGDLDVQNITGDVHASCINGRLRASGLRGRTDLSTINGRLEVAYAPQSLGTQAGAGPSPGTPPVLGAPAPMAVPESGTSARFGNDAHLKSVNGSVDVTIPSDTNAEVTAKTVHGNIQNDFGLPVDDGRYVGHALAGRLGAGSARIQLKNVNGSISLHRASDGKPLAPVTNLLQPRHETF